MAKALTRVGTAANPTWTEASVNNKLLSSFGDTVRWESGIRPRKVLTQSGSDMSWQLYDQHNGNVYTNYLTIPNTAGEYYVAMSKTGDNFTASQQAPSSSLGWGNYLKIVNPGLPLFVMVTRFMDKGIVGYAIGDYNYIANYTLDVSLISQSGNLLQHRWAAGYSDAYGSGQGITNSEETTLASVSGYHPTLIGVLSEAGNHAWTPNSSNQTTIYMNGDGLSYEQTSPDCFSLTRPAHDDGGPGGRGKSVGYFVNGMPVCFYQMSYAGAGYGPMSGTALGVYSGLTAFAGITLTTTSGQKREIVTGTTNLTTAMNCSGIGLTTV